jgi:hypothetical protein
MPELPAETGSLLSQKAGPLPMWAWGVVILGGAYGFRLYQSHKSGRNRVETPTNGYSSADLPSNIQPQYTIVEGGGSQSYVNSPVTTIGRNYGSLTNGPFATGDMTTVTPPPPAPTPAPPPPPPPAPVPPPPPPPPPAPVPVPAPPAPKGQWLTVVKWNPNDRNAPSTLSGLALKAYGNASLWQRIWNAPQNADLARRRGAPTRIQPGDRFWAPG